MIYFDRVEVVNMLDAGHGTYVDVLLLPMLVFFACGRLCIWLAFSNYMILVEFFFFLK